MLVSTIPYRNSAPRVSGTAVGGGIRSLFFHKVFVGFRIRRYRTNGPFPSCCLSRFRSESWCSTIVREMSLICIRIRNSYPFEWLCTRTRFETEACSNSEMGYLLWIGLPLETHGCIMMNVSNIYFISVPTMNRRMRSLLTYRPLYLHRCMRLIGSVGKTQCPKGGLVPQKAVRERKVSRQTSFW